ncbi:hypothetical protein BDN72DRAFT_429567 [Pluteus cervinus]|uniref:Uncharacterized protein n=1 Tax=Pluteus cervinus TaxID=181527 RepID=A0ACD3A7U5_9AGAR|nr:hypothetical protein BDN72DRAFT_429567 [Pluteus cervinus]
MRFNLSNLLVLTFSLVNAHLSLARAIERDESATSSLIDLIPEKCKAECTEAGIACFIDPGPQCTKGLKTCIMDCIADIVAGGTEL